MFALLASVAALALGPLTYRLARRGRAALAMLDGFVFVTIAGLVGLTVLPETAASGGWGVVVFAALGFVTPTLAERLFHRAAKQTHMIALVLGVFGLVLHAMLDGTALASPARGLPLAVIVHRFPAGLTIWWLLRPHFGRQVPAATLGLVAIATGVGFAMGPTLTTALAGPGVAWLQAAVAGSLLHVAFFRPHLGDDSAHAPTPPHRARLEGTGALLGIGLLVALSLGTHEHATGRGQDIWTAFLTLSLESAPALLLAYTAAGLISVFLPSSSIRWMGRGGPLSNAARGMVVGLPLPICSCGVVPLYRTFIAKGAPPSAAVAFLIATPELGLDAVFMSVPLLGADMAIARVVAAAVVALAVGWLVGRWVPRRPADDLTGPAEPAAGRWARAKRGLRIGFGPIVDDTAPWILLGLAVAAAAAPFMAPGTLRGFAGGADVLVLALVGVPLYVCASAATPLVAVLLAGGVSPGAALAFLITGPATNLTTFGVLHHLHGRRAAVALSLSVVGVSVTLGYLLNAVAPTLGHRVPAASLEEAVSPGAVSALVVLGVVFAVSLWRRGPRGFVAELSLT